MDERNICNPIEKDDFDGHERAYAENSISSEFKLMKSPDIPEMSSNKVYSNYEQRTPNMGHSNDLSDLSRLASANFSTDSLVEPVIMSSNPITSPMSPTFNINSAQSNNSYPKYRRYSNTSLNNSPILQHSAPSHIRANSNARVRPKSAIFLNDSNYAIAEDDSPIQSTFNNAPRARNSANFSQRVNYIPPVNIAPPTEPMVISSNSRSSSPSRSTSPLRGHNYRSKSPIRRPSSPSKSFQPFNFKPQEIMLNNNGSNHSLQVKPAHRKGHKYKHSSVSMNLFQELPPAVGDTTQQLSIPDSHPIPNLKESIASINPLQRIKLMWSGLHMAFAFLTFVSGFKFKLTSLSTLAHLIFYDALGSLVVVSVDIMSNFDVWNSSSIVYPFGLERLEVLVGFALGASLMMVGGDLISHVCEELVILLVVKNHEDHDGEQHSSHHVHGEHGHHANWLVYEVILSITIVVTLVTSNFILASERINEIMSSTEANTSKKAQKMSKGIILGRDIDSPPKSFLERVRSISRAWAKNPTHLLTLSYSMYLILAPIIPSNINSQTAIDLDELSTLAVALLLCFTGWKLVKSLGGILLLSYPHSDYDYTVLKSIIIDKILLLGAFKRSYSIEKLFITKFNYQLFVVGLNLNMRGGSVDEESQLRFEIDRLIRSAIYEKNNKDSKIEITIDINRF